MKIPSIWAEILLLVCLWIYECFWISLWIEPMSDVGSSCDSNWITKWVRVIFLNQFCEIVNLIEHRDPAVVGSVVNQNFRWNIIVSYFVWSW